MKKLHARRAQPNLKVMTSRPTKNHWNFQLPFIKQTPFGDPIIGSKRLVILRFD